MGTASGRGGDATSFNKPWAVLCHAHTLDACEQGEKSLQKARGFNPMHVFKRGRPGGIKSS